MTTHPFRDGAPFPLLPVRETDTSNVWALIYVFFFIYYTKPGGGGRQREGEETTKHRQRDKNIPQERDSISEERAEMNGTKDKRVKHRKTREAKIQHTTVLERQKRAHIGPLLNDDWMLDVHEAKKTPPCHHHVYMT